ncbi:MAG: FhaA domain-containing protein, partial [bacterium]
MGLKDKIKTAWKRVSDLEDESAGAGSQATGRERIPFKEISKKLKEVMKQNVDVVGRKIVVPNYYAIHFSETDRKARLEVEDVLCDELREELFHEMRKINPEQSKREVLIEIKTDSSLEKGQFRIVHHIRKPTQEEESISEVDASAPKSSVDEEKDYLQTVVEQVPEAIPDDDQKTIVQPPERSVLYKLQVDS